MNRRLALDEMVPGAEPKGTQMAEEPLANDVAIQWAKRAVDRPPFELFTVVMRPEAGYHQFVSVPSRPFLCLVGSISSFLFVIFVACRDCPARGMIRGLPFPKFASLTMSVPSRRSGRRIRRRRGSCGSTGGGRNTSGRIGCAGRMALAPPVSRVDPRGGQ